MYNFFSQSLSFYYTLITLALCIATYIIIKSIAIAYKREKESIQNALKAATQELSLTKEFSKETLKPFEKEEAIIRNNTIQKTEKSSETTTTKESIELLQRTAEISNLIKKSEVLIGQKKFKDAEKCLIQGLSYNERHKKLLELISQVYLSLQQYSKAIFFLDTFFAHHKENVATCNNYALAHFYIKQFPTTITYYSKAIALEPNNPTRYENLGKIFLALENFEDAGKCYIEASKLDTKNREYHKTIAECFKKETKYQEAKTWYEKILEFSPYDKETLQALEDLNKLGF